MSSQLRRILIVTFLVLTGVFGLLFWTSRPEARAAKEKKFSVKVYPKEKVDPAALEKVGGKLNYKGSVKKVTRYKKTKIGYRLVFYYPDQVTLSNMKDWLDKKKVESKILKDEESGKLFMQCYNNFATKKQAEAKIDDLYKLTAWKFSPEDNYKKEPYQSQIVIFSDVLDSDIEQLKADLTAAGAEEVKAQPMSGDSVEVPDEETGGEE